MEHSGRWIWWMNFSSTGTKPICKVVSIAVFLCYPIYPIDMMIHMLRMSSIKLEEVGRRRSSHVPPPPAQVLLTISWIPLGIHIICTYYTWVSTVGCRLYSLLTPNIYEELINSWLMININILSVFFCPKHPVSWKSSQVVLVCQRSRNSGQLFIVI